MGRADGIGFLLKVRGLRWMDCTEAGRDGRLVVVEEKVESRGCTSPDRIS